MLVQSKKKMARKRTAIKRRTGADSYKKIKCMNHDPENSKWGEYAPSLNGCDEIVEVPVETERVLCWRCTMRSTSGVKF